MKRTTMLLLLPLLVLLAGCPQPGPTDPPPNESSEAEPAVDLEAEKLRLIEEYGNVFGGLTQEEMQQDLDYLWLTMQQSYPYLGVAQRQGIDAEALYNRYLEELPQITDDIHFHNHLRHFAEELDSIGHFEYIFESDAYNRYYDGYLQLSEYSPHSSVLAYRIQDPLSAQNYARLAELNSMISALEPPTDSPAVAEEDSENLSIVFLVEYNAAYVKINSFREKYMERDREELQALYRDAAEAGFEHLIIDITGNGGGSDLYWMQNIVAPNISAPLSRENTILFADTPDIAEYVGSIVPDSSIRPASLLQLPALNTDDLAALDGYFVNTVTVEPDEQIPFTGKIWVLVDESVYSSSESFCMFCKQTGFAAIAGQPTGGDGGGIDPLIFTLPEFGKGKISGIDPLIFTLPNSGAVYRFNVLYTINPDGSNSEEAGTVPDIPAEPGETPLGACLRIISAEA